MNIKKKVNSNTRFRKRISYFYILVILIGALLLFSPLATQNNNYISFLDSFFISASAFSDTGLSTVITIDTFNNFGQLVILILIQLGGLGIMSFKIFLLVLVGKKINTRDRLLVYTEHNLNNSSGIVRLVKDIVRIIIIFEIV
ncbi:MAG: TrkH family potassium uptake protein, partial [Bacilli bacterium]|nr:TrkH family potassium uptake protein [Bacilli bacterium]